jgi:ribosome biogenesis GTPase A
MAPSRFGKPDNSKFSRPVKPGRLPKSTKPEKTGKPTKQAGPPTAFARLMKQLQAVDILFEVRDARVPLSSRHPKVDELFGHKPRVIVLAKQDLADAEQVQAWLERFGDENEREAMALSFKLNKGQDKLVSAALRITEEKRKALENKGLLPRAMRACVIGLPNTGKSTLINWLVGRRKALTGNKPGVTKGTQWVRVHPQLELLDTPGILPPVAFSAEVSLRLALCNLVPNEHYDIKDVAAAGLAIMNSHHPESLKIYGQGLVQSGPTLENLAVARSCLAPGGLPDTRRAAAIFLNDFRSGRLGRVVLDQP